MLNKISKFCLSYDGKPKKIIYLILTDNTKVSTAWSELTNFIIMETLTLTDTYGSKCILYF